MEETFIRSYYNVLDLDFIDYLISYADNKNLYRKRKSKRVSDSQIPLEAFFKDLSMEVDNRMIMMLSQYFEEFPHLISGDSEWVSGATILQKTNPTEGYHEFHYENGGWDEQKRLLAWMIYLNDVEKGGETEFLYQKMRIKPQKNVALIWPASFTHIHRGLTPISGTKYILTGWFSPVDRMRKFKLSNS